MGGSLGEGRLLAWIIGQVSTDGSGGLNGAIDIVSKLGVAAIFIWLYLRAEAERKKAQEEKTAVLERLIPMVEAATRAMDSVQKSQQTTMDPELIKAIARLNNITDDLNESTQLKKPRRTSE